MTTTQSEQPTEPSGPQSTRDREPRKPAHLVVAIHGILTGRTDPTWPVRLRAWCLLHHREARVVTWPYYELPLPRLAARRNRARIENILATLRLHLDYLDAVGEPYHLSVVGHSNGGYLIHEIARALIEHDGRAIATYVTSSPAVPAGPTTRDLVRWIEQGSIGGATLIRARRDSLLRWVDAVPRVVTWPWGALGHAGWQLTGQPSRAVRHSLRTIDLELDDHTSFLGKDRCADTFARHIWPALDPTIHPASIGAGPTD